jgi:hypothetical protein
MRRAHRRVHRRAWLLLALLLPGLLAGAAWLRTQRPADAPVRLAPP